MLRYAFIFCFSLLLASCYPERSAPGYHSFGWTPDGKSVVAIIQDFAEYPHTDAGKVIVVYNSQGQEIARRTVENPIKKDAFFDKLFFNESGNEFYAQIGDDVYLVNIETGSQVKLLPAHKFIVGSRSGKIILTESLNATRDSLYRFILDVTGTQTRVISAWTSPAFPNSFSVYLDNRNTTFIGDSSLAFCHSDSSVCSLTIFDTLFHSIFKASAPGKPALFPTFASGGNVILHRSQEGFSFLSFLNNSETVLRSDIEHLTSLDISPSGSLAVYSVNNDGQYVLNPGTLTRIDVPTKIETVIHSNSLSSGQISPDGSRIAYFILDDGDIKIQIVNIP